MAWTDQMVEDLRVMWKQGLTTAEIGKKLGVSKNSIVGKVHRLGLSGRPSPIKKKETTEEAETKNTAAPKEKSAKPEKESAKTTVSAAKENVKEAKPAQVNAEKTTEKKEPEKSAVSKPEAKPEPEVKECFKSDLEKSAKAVSLMELDNHTCRWPLGDPKDENFRFCGKKVCIGQTYCEEHSAIAYVKPGKTK